MAELHADPDYSARMHELDQQRLATTKLYLEAARPILKQLASRGFLVESLSELRLTPDCAGAVTVLVEWLPRVTNPYLKEDLVRTLSVPWAASAAPALIAEFKRADGPMSDGLRWAIANALAVVADDSVLGELVPLVEDKKYAKAREMLTLALGNMRNPLAVDVLIRLLDDDRVVGHAAMALGKLKATAARVRLEALREHRTKWVRTEVKKALTRMDSAL